MFESLRLWWHRRKTRLKMDRVFSRGEDPYNYRGSPYETARLAAMEAALGGRKYARALEVGCAEGAFTERLIAHADHVTAVDISEVALARARQRPVPIGHGAEFAAADIRDWSPTGDFDVIVLGDVLYYLDKPMVREQFEKTFPRVAGWLVPGARLILAHGFAGPQERVHRQSFRERFEKEGLALVSESVVAGDGPVSCLLSVLERPAR